MKTKTVLISGGTKGMGRSFTLKLLEEGYNVVAFSRKKENVDILEKELLKKYDKSIFTITVGDLAKEADIDSVVKEAIKKFGNIDILVNNAGTGYFAECDKGDMQSFQQMLETNLIGLTMLTKAVVPYMKKSKKGLIINIVSISGKKVYPNGEFYSATKFAVMGYSEGIRTELKEYGIKVCTICPGMTKTDFFGKDEIKRRENLWGKFAMLEAEDIARAVSFVCSQPEHCDIQDMTVMPF